MFNFVSCFIFHLEMLKLYRLSDVDRLMSGRKIRYLNATNANRITIGYDEL